jgi:two-component system, NtrC family, response regulator AtoC
VGRDSTLDDTARHDHGGATVLLVAGEGMLATYALTRAEVTIGRGDDCEIVVPSPTLSRRHAKLRVGPPMTVQDLGSRNGTRVGGALQRGGDPVALAVGDAFHIGRLSFLVLGAAQHRSLGTSAASSDYARALRVIDPSVKGVPPLVADIAKSGVNVLILGETGVGKEVLAATLHRLSGRTGPFLQLNCAALSPTLIESELFGHEKGAFTGASDARPGLLASAHGGTVLLDEVGELPQALQAKLLRVLETREVLRIGATRPLAVDVRFIAATNRDLPAEAARGQFRADLYFRLDGVTLEIPPLKQRRHLIGPLALTFLDEAQAKADTRAQLATEALRLLESHDWPGNVRELKTTVERALLLARGRDLKPRHFQLRPSPPPPEDSEAPRAASDDAGGDDERARIIAALDACAGNQTRAAKQLGISRATLVNKLAIHNIPRPRK